jgi:hypothetical protein
MIAVQSMKGAGLGFLAVVHPYNKEIILKVLKEIKNENFDHKTISAIERFVLKHQAEFLLHYDGRNFGNSLFETCHIDEQQNSITFITALGTILFSKAVFFSRPNGETISITISRRNNMYFKPPK